MNKSVYYQENITPPPLFFAVLYNYNVYQVEPTLYNEQNSIHTLRNKNENTADR
jgi:hypothetical protein